MKFKNKTIVITGAGTSVDQKEVGFGHQIAKDLHSKGANIVILGRDIYRLRDSMSRILKSEQIDEGTFFQCDVGDEKSVERVFGEIQEIHGAVYGLVNNAAINISRTNTIDTDIGDLRKMLDVNYMGVFICNQNAIRQMIGNGGGSIVNISSVGGVSPLPNMSPYCSIKAAIEMLTRSDARDFKDKGIRVNAVRPGYARTPLTANFLASMEENDPGQLRILLDRQPLGGLVTPQQVSRGVLYFLDPQCSKTGEFLEVANGFIPDRF